MTLMEVPRQTLEQVYLEITTSVGYITTVGPVDKSKVSRRRDGQKTELPSAKLARAAWRVAGLLAPAPPPPVTYKKVAPRVAYQEGGSDARFCVINQPGVVQIGSGPNAGKWTDESGAIYANEDGLDESGIRSGEPAVTGAKQIDGRPYCSLPTMGDPKLNTGSWKI